MVNELSLFTGTGGGLLGTMLAGCHPVCGVEIDPYCRAVLLGRQRDGLLPLFPLWDDVRTFDGRAWYQRVDLLSAGFPCQPFSQAGRRLDGEDDRNLWPETARVIGEVQPGLVFLENVPRLLSCGYFGRVLYDLDSLGFDAEWDVVSAFEVGAPHVRKRLWVLARHRDPSRGGIPDSLGECVWDEWKRLGKQHEVTRTAVTGDDGEPRIVADSDTRRRGVIGESQHDDVEGASRNLAHRCGTGGWGERSDVPDADGSGLSEQRGHWWEAEPDVRRVVDGCPSRVDRLASLGNGQVPGVALVALRKLIGLFKETDR